MKQGTSTITTVFSNEVDGITYEYTTTQLAGQIPQTIVFVVRRDTDMLIRGHDKTNGNFYFETLSANVTAEDRKTINDQINADLVEVKVLAEGINITSK